MKSHHLFTLISCFHHCAFAASVLSNDASNSNAVNPLNGAPAEPPLDLRVADFFDVPMPHVDLREGAAVGGAAVLEILREGVNGAGKVLNPTSEEDDSIHLTGQETWQAETLCPKEMFGMRTRSVCDNGNPLDVSYTWPTKAWMLRNAVPCPWYGLCDPYALQWYWCCRDFGDDFMGLVAKDCEPFRPIESTAGTPSATTVACRAEFTRNEPEIRAGKELNIMMQGDA